MKRIRLLGISASLILLAGSVGAQTAFFTNGVVRHQFWSDNNPNGVSSPTRLQVEQGKAGNPTFDDFSTPTMDALAARTAAPTLADFNLAVFDTPEEEGDNYVDRVSTLFIPPTTGKYVFFLASDDDSDLFLSTDSTPANKKLIASQASWSNMDAWGTGQLRSDQFTNASGTPYSNGIALVAGQKYWLEAIHHEGGGGDQVGATFKLVGDPDPASGTASALTAAVIGYGVTFTAPITVAKQVTNATATVGTGASFVFVPNNPSSDSLVNNALVYQWFRNGTAITGANGQAYTLVATSGDNGAQFNCVASLDPIYNLSLSVTSAVGTLTVNNNSVTYTNGLKVQMFLGSNRQQVESGSTGPADSTTVSVNGAEAVPNDGINNYGRRMSGWYIPPTTGKYVFFLSSDDDADLFLSTDSTPQNKVLIAQESNWSASREWADPGSTNSTSAGGTLLSQKRSDLWTNGVGDAPFTNGIQLTAGTPYYIEADSHQGGGGDNLGVLAQVVGTPDPTNGAPPIPANQLSLITSLATNLSWVTQPHAITVFEGGAPILTASAKSDSEFAVLYQWQREGTNIAGATGTSYSFTTTIADNNSHFAVIASTAEGGLSITSTVATVTVQTAVFEPGLALMNYWVNQPDQTAGEKGLLGKPDFAMTVPSFEVGVNNENGDRYVNEVSGFFIPATSDKYDFIVTGDDHIDLFLSTDSNPNNKRLIAQEPGWSAQLTWNTDNGGGNDLVQKNSATWSNAATASVPFANGISLTTGTKYYMEMWHQEGGGGDSAAATYVHHGGAVQGDGTDSLITGTQLGFNAANTATYVEFTNQPVSTSALSGGTATLQAGGISDSTTLIGTTGQFQTGTTAGDTNFLKFPNLLFQWYKNGTLIPGATTSAYTTPPLKPGDTAQYYAGIRAVGMATWSNSTTATITVITDTNKPTVFASEFDNNLVPTVSVSFNKAMDLASISDMTHYSVSGATIAAILVNSNDARHVTLQLTAAPTTLPASLTLTGITDFSGNAPAASTVSVAASELTNLDIGVVGDPAFPGFMWVDGTNAYTIKCEGSDIWGADDGFNFSYETKTGDFDVAVRQMTFTKTSQWSKGGLMAREDLTSGSRNWNIINGPSSADGTEAQDNNGIGQNQVECNARLATGVASNTGWDQGPRPAVTYPNAWVRLKRVGNTLTAFSSSNGVQWVQRAYTDWSTNAVPMPATVYVGICGSSHNNDAPTADPPLHYYTASFDQYNSAFVPPTGGTQATVSASISGGNIVISWTPTGGTLQSTTALGAGATWSTVGTANPATIPLSGGGAKFFRVGP